MLSYSSNVWNTRRQTSSQEVTQTCDLHQIRCAWLQSGGDGQSGQTEKRGKRWTGHSCHGSGEEPRPCKGNITAETREVFRRTCKERWCQGTSKQLCLKHSGWRLYPLDRKSVETLQARLLAVSLPRSVIHTLPEYFPKVTTFSAFPGGWESQLKSPWGMGESSLSKLKKKNTHLQKDYLIDF